MTDSPGKDGKDHAADEIVESVQLTPDTTVDNKDRGDDTLRRFRYQITYACKVSLHMIIEDDLIECVYCEHFEDVLVKLANGKYSGVQIKTREAELGPFECDEEPIENSILKFIALELAFSDQFERYTIVSNVSFSKKNRTTDLNRIVELVKSGSLQELTNPRTNICKWIKKLAKAANCDVEVVHSTLKKCKLQPSSSLLDIRKDLIHTLQGIQDLKHLTYGQLATLADKLIQIHWDASSLLLDNLPSSLFSSFSSEPNAEVKAIILSKRITKELLRSIIEEVKNNPVTLFIKDAKQINDLPAGYTVLEKKMDAGGITKENIDLFKDNKFSFETLMSSWLYKDSAEADKKYNQVRLIVQNEASAVYDAMAQNSTAPFGTAMLVDIRKNLRERYRSDKGDFFDCKLEHLYGVAGTLTEDCTLWWSPKFDLEP